jgi:hypothetical protein
LYHDYKWHCYSDSIKFVEHSKGELRSKQESNKESKQSDYNEGHEEEQKEDIVEEMTTNQFLNYILRISHSVFCIIKNIQHHIYYLSTIQCLIFDSLYTLVSENISTIAGVYLKYSLI